ELLNARKDCRHAGEAVVLVEIPARKPLLRLAVAALARGAPPRHDRRARQGRLILERCRNHRARVAATRMKKDEEMICRMLRRGAEAVDLLHSEHSPRGGAGLYTV